MTNVPPKILWRQCSEFICANPNISESVRGRPSSFSILCRYSISSFDSASPSCSLYASRFSTCLIGSGLCATLNTFWSSPSYIRWSIGSCSAPGFSTGKYSSMRKMPSSPMFWVISTAFVLHGVTISRRGPTKWPSSVSLSTSVASPYSQHSSSISLSAKRWSHSVAIMLFCGVLKKSIMPLLYFGSYCFRSAGGCIAVPKPWR